MSRVLEMTERLRLAALALGQRRLSMEEAMKELAEARTHLSAVVDYAEAAHKAHAETLAEFDAIRDEAKTAWEERA